MKLFITGRSIRSDIAIENLRQAMTDHANEEYDLTIIDVLENPQLAEDELILATPTLIKLSPSPVRRTIGDLSDHKALLRGLDLHRRRVDPETT